MYRKNFDYIVANRVSKIMFIAFSAIHLITDIRPYLEKYFRFTYKCLLRRGLIVN